MSEDFLKLIKQAKAYIPSGASFTGDLSEQARKLFSLVDGMTESIISTHPGDYIRVGSDKDHGISLAAPIGYDVWYLYSTKNVLSGGIGRLSGFFSKLQDIKPLKTLRDKNDLSHITPWGLFNIKSYWENSAPYMIKEMRYETVLKGKSFQYYSDGMPKGAVGFFAFPIGQLGVMEIVSLTGESMAEEEISGEEAIVESNSMMPPVHHNRGACIGKHLIEEGYIIQDNAEYLATDFEGCDSAEPHRWLRYWLQPGDTFPIPGEFVALLAKPELFHVWWFQETYPFVYSGNYWENEYYTSGIVSEVIESEEDFNTYKVWVREEEIECKPTDFYSYAVGKRVAIIKEISEVNNNFNWNRLSSSENWRIAPITFYR